MRNELNAAAALPGVDVYRAAGHLDALEASVHAYGPSHPRIGLHWGPALLTLTPEAAAELARCLSEALSALDESAREAEEVRRA